MDYEKAYKEALERCKKEFDFSNLAYSHEEIKQKLEHVFPELKENEDEKIRKEITEFLKRASGGFLDATTHCKTFGKWLTWLEKQGEQKSWSEEDEKLLNSAISLVYEVGDINLHSWLKSIKDRVQPQPKQEWSKEDSKRLDRIYKFIWANRKGDTDEVYQQEQDAEWLMTLNPQPKQVWSEEDENMLLSIINDSEQGALLDKEQINWLKSIKSNYWKPSEEQMKWLKDVIETVPMTCRQQLPLESLYNDLKNL